MTAIVRREVPWIGGFHPKAFGLSHQWMQNSKPNNMARNNIKYGKVDVAMREAKRREWNGPVLWPVVLIGLALAAFAVPAVVSYRRRERMAARKA